MGCFSIVAVQPGPSTATAINSYLTGTSICASGGGTPTHLALQQALSSGGVQDLTRPNFVILLTDGVSFCDSVGDTSPEAVQAVKNLLSSNPLVKTFVVVIVPGLLDVDYNNMAISGGVPKASGPPHYYEVNSGTDLATAFDTIAEIILSSP